MNPVLYGALVTLFGMTIVFLVIIGLWGILAMMKTLFGGKKKHNNEQVAIEGVSSAAVSQTVAAGDADADEIIAVITAAINACLGGQSNLVVRSITRVGDKTPIWGQIGRHEQMLNRF